MSSRILRILSIHYFDFTDSFSKELLFPLSFLGDLYKDHALIGLSVRTHPGVRRITEELPDLLLPLQKWRSFSETNASQGSYKPSVIIPAGLSAKLLHILCPCSGPKHRWIPVSFWFGHPQYRCRNNSGFEQVEDSNIPYGYKFCGA